MTRIFQATINICVESHILFFEYECNWHPKEQVNIAPPPLPPSFSIFKPFIDFIKIPFSSKF